MTFYTGTPQNSKAKLVRLLTEMTHRRTRVYEHPAFDRVDPVHIKNSKHYRQRAGDLNRFHGNAEENYTFDRFAVELMARGWGVIWNRGVRDHDRHLHVETIAYRSENYSGRTKLKNRAYPGNRDRLNVNGSLNKATVAELQRSFGTYIDGKMDWGGSLGRAMQASMNTELNVGLVLDGKFGTKSVDALNRYFGYRRTGTSRLTSAQIAEIQRRLNKHGHIFRDA